jgi:hypothetical protein
MTKHALEGGWKIIIEIHILIYCHMNTSGLYTIRLFLAPITYASCFPMKVLFLQKTFIVYIAFSRFLKSLLASVFFTPPLKLCEEIEMFRLLLKPDPQ